MGTLILTTVLAFILGTITGVALTIWLVAMNWHDIQRRINE